MKATELRIGNLVTDGEFTYIITELSFEHGITAQRKDDGAIMYPDEIIGIPITNEWLTKAGFWRDDVLADYVLDIKTIGFEMLLAYTKGLIGLYHSSPDYAGANIVRIKYVHQLQNLYFCLRIKELKFKL